MKFIYGFNTKYLFYVEHCNQKKQYIGFILMENDCHLKIKDELIGIVYLPKAKTIILEKKEFETEGENNEI